LFGFVTKHACDGRTDRQNYDSQDRASIATRAVIKLALETRVVGTWNPHSVYG